MNTTGLPITQWLTSIGAAALLAERGWALVPVLPCTRCGLALPADHTCPTTKAAEPGVRR